MTLNASGPLSLGGSTTGQSINLELGVSATALASIDSTSFRTLAGVASGQISISNFYGKSSSTAFILYLGTSGTALTKVSFYNGWRVNNLGIMAFNTGDSSRVQYINATGTSLIASKDYANGNYSTKIMYMGFQNKWPSSTDYFATSQQGYRGQIYSSSNGYSGSIILGSYSGQNAYLINSATGNPDGTISFAGDNDQGKYGWKPVFWKVSPSGPTFLNGRRSNSNYRSAPDIFGKLLLKTDGTYFFVNDTGGNCEIYNYSSTFVDLGGARNISLGLSNNIGGAVLDTSNNLYIAMYDGSIYKVTSSLAAVNRYFYSTLNPTRPTFYPAMNWGMDIYNDILYFAGSQGDSSSLTIVAITASTMAVLWTKRWTFQAPNNILLPLTSYSYGVAIQARPTGVYVSFQAYTNFTSTGGYVYTMCLPLDGNVANQTVTINGTSQQLTITSPTTTVTSNTFSVSGISGPGDSDVGGNLNPNLTTIEATPLPTLTKTSY